MGTFLCICLLYTSICGLCFNDTGLLFVFGLFGVQSLPYGACLGQNETISVSHRYGSVSYTHLNGNHLSVEKEYEESMTDSAMNVSW